MTRTDHDTTIPVETRELGGSLSPDDFVADLPNPRARAADVPRANPRLITGVSTRALGKNADARGHLIELHSQRQKDDVPRVHVYQVFAEPGSIRAWVYHRSQTDFLAFPDGDFQIALYDLRADSPTHGRLNVLRLGEAQPTLLILPPYVVHGVCNVGSKLAAFINMPDAVWRSEAPDKHRLAYPDTRLPFTFG